MEPSASGSRQFTTNVVSLIGVCNAHGLEVLFVTQPTLLKTDMTDEEHSVCWMLRTEYEGRVYRMTPGAARSSFGAYNRLLVDTCEQHKVANADLFTAMDGSLDYFYDDVHFNDAGADFAARFVADRLQAVAANRQP